GVTRFGFPWSSRPPCSGPTPTSLVHLLPPRVMIPSTPLTLIDRLLSFEAGAVPVRRLSLTLRKELTVTHDDASAHRVPSFDEPTTDRFLYAGWSVDPPTKLPVVGSSDRRERMIDRCRDFAATAEAREGVVSATVYRTRLIPPLPDIPRYDVLMLIRTHTAHHLTQVRSDLGE